MLPNRSSFSILKPKFRFVQIIRKNIQKMKMLIKTLLLIAILLALVSSATVSLTNVVQSQKYRRPSLPDHCIAWTGEKCEKCQEGYWPDNEGKCFLQLIEDGPGEVEEDEQLGYIVSDNYVPCQGSQHCSDSLEFASSIDFEKFISQYQQRETYEKNLIPQKNSFSINSADFSGAAARMVAPQAQAVVADRDFSGTNNQEENVDEADILKTDGTYIYSISNGILSIIRGYPSTSISVLSTVQLEDRPSALFIQGNYLTIFGTRYEKSPPIYRSTQQAIFALPYIQPSQPLTFIKIYDVSNRSRPKLIKNFEVDGSYFNGRKTEDGFVYLLTKTRIYSYTLPWYNFGNKQISFPFSRLFYYPGRYSSPLYLSIFTFNLANPFYDQRGFACLITENAQTVYMSERAIYISYTDYSRSSDESVIHKIYVRKNRIIPYADTRIRGTINNQFSMDEYYQVLRVATTSNQAAISNNVYCLDYFLNKIGSINEIAPGERIFSARFVDRRLYLVTFRQVDPFFVISFKNHRYPKILGQLKITGFSRYLHPYDENTIIGLGRQADLNGRQQGLKISLFDVSNVQAPRQADSFQLQEKYASSSAEWEHKAFLFSKNKDLMAIPGSMNYNNTKFNGAFVFYIDSSTIRLKGIVDHLESENDIFYKRNVERSFYIEELLYTKSQCILRVNRIQDLSEIKNIHIPCEKNEIRPLPKPLPIPQPVWPIQLPEPIIEQPIEIDPPMRVDPIQYYPIYSSTRPYLRFPRSYRTTGTISQRNYPTIEPTYYYPSYRMKY